MHYYISMIDTADCLQFIKKILIETEVIIIERETLLENLVRQTFCSRSLGNILLEAHWTATTLWLGFEYISVGLTLKHITDSLFLFLHIVQFHYTHGIAKSIVNLLLFITKFINDTEVSLQILTITFGHKIIDNRCLLLSITINTSITLFKSDETPRNVIVEHDVTEVVKVYAL